MLISRRLLGNPCERACHQASSTCHSRSSMSHAQNICILVHILISDPQHKLASTCICIHIHIIIHILIMHGHTWDRGSGTGGEDLCPVVFWGKVGQPSRSGPWWSVYLGSLARNSAGVSGWPERHRQAPTASARSQELRKSVST
jgi:hypothetical protein